jgi:DNA processing protein
MARKLGRDLAERGVVIVSGLALGIDSGALNPARGATIGVLGCGIDIVYTKEGKKLLAHAQMIKRGEIISEFAMGTFPGAQTFPIRNRINAGMSFGTTVVERAEHSGSLITARLVMGFGREVFGIAGNPTPPSSFGPNQLIKQGAKLVTSWEDGIEELPTSVRAQLVPVESATRIWVLPRAFSRSCWPRIMRWPSTTCWKKRGSARRRCWPPYLTWSLKAW